MGNHWLYQKYVKNYMGNLFFFNLGVINISMFLFCEQLFKLITHLYLDWNNYQVSQCIEDLQICYIILLSQKFDDRQESWELLPHL